MVEGKIMPKREYPEYLKWFPQIKGIFANGCIYGEDYRKLYPKMTWQAAHAHSSPDEKRAGWICLRREGLIHNRFLLLHEVAHLIAAGHNNDYVWAYHLLSIGGTLDEFIIERNSLRIILCEDMHELVLSSMA